MNNKKLLSLAVVLALVLSMLPTLALAEPAITPIMGPRVESIRTKAAVAGPTLSSGNHQSYLDRVESMPDYAVEYYNWMVEHSGADGALADPTLATEYYGEYYYSVDYVSGTVKFNVTADMDAEATASEIAHAELEKEFSIFGSWAGAVHDIFDREHPEVFWLSGRTSISYMGGWSYSIRNKVCTVMYQADMVVWLQYPGFDIRDNQYLDPQNVAADIEVRDAMVQQILADCPEGSDYDRVAYLNDVLTSRNAYNSAVAIGKSSQAEASAWECISALVGSSGTAGPVCEGYARAFQVLCNELQIPCVLVDGKAIGYVGEEPEDHMWNYVMIDGGWYAADVTWNDPYLASMPETTNTGYENRDWLLLGSDSEVSPGLTFLESHVVENRIRSDGLAFPNGPVLEREGYNPNAITLYSISGSVTSAGNDDVTVQLLQDGAVLATQTHTGTSATYTFDQVAPGNYQLSISKAEHVTYTYDLTVAEEALTHDVKLRQLGDVTGDKRINVGDVARLYGHIKKTNIITDAYVLLCMDLTGDGRLNVGDTARLYARVRG